MKPGMKMLMMDRMQRQAENNRSEYGGGNRRMIGYDRNESGNANTSNYGGMEGGGAYNGGSRNEYDEGRYGYGRSETESRRRRDSRGRYAMGGSRMDGDYEDEDDDDKRSQTWYPPNMMGGSRYGFSDVHADIYAPNAMNRPMDGMMAMMSGGDMSEPVDEHTARKWVQKMDGGEHFKMEQADQMRAAMCPECERYEFFVAINAMYSDHCETAKKIGMDKPDFYAMLAKDFLKDADAKPHKLRRYMEHIAK